VPLAESRELGKARRRIREMENEVEILRRAPELLETRPITQPDARI